jgi:hypothetical protein
VFVPIEQKDLPPRTVRYEDTAVVIDMNRIRFNQFGGLILPDHDVSDLTAEGFLPDVVGSRYGIEVFDPGFFRRQGPEEIDLLLWRGTTGEREKQDGSQSA